MMNQIAFAERSIDVACTRFHRVLHVIQATIATQVHISFSNRTGFDQNFSGTAISTTMRVFQRKYSGAIKKWMMYPHPRRPFRRKWPNPRVDFLQFVIVSVGLTWFDEGIHFAAHWERNLCMSIWHLRHPSNSDVSFRPVTCVLIHSHRLSVHIDQRNCNFVREYAIYSLCYRL